MPGVLAHAPLKPDNNESLATATLVPEPTKSWAIYAELHEGGEAQYYRFDINEGQRIHVMLFKSTNPEDDEFLPGFVLMGPEIGEQGDVPDYVETPLGSKALVVEGEQPDQASYEPFSPSSFYSLADATLDAPSSGTYYIAVFEPYRGGHYGLAIGDRESYTLAEWILIPLNLISVYQWEGQSLAFIFIPMIATLAIGIGLAIWQMKKRENPRTIPDWIKTLAGLLFIGSGVTILQQMVVSLIQASLTPEIAITVVLVLVPILLGIGTLRLSLIGEGKTSFKKRIYLAILGVVALFAWAGLLIGPALAVIASVIPRASKQTI